MSSVDSYPERPNLPCGEGSKRKREPSSKLRKVIRGRTVVGAYSGCREGLSLLCYFSNVVVYCCFDVGTIDAVVFVLVVVLVDIVVFRCGSSGVVFPFPMIGVSGCSRLL